MKTRPCHKSHIKVAHVSGEARRDGWEIGAPRGIGEKGTLAAATTTTAAFTERSSFTTFTATNIVHAVPQAFLAGNGDRGEARRDRTRRDGAERGWGPLCVWGKLRENSIKAVWSKFLFVGRIQNKSEKKKTRKPRKQSREKKTFTPSRGNSPNLLPYTTAQSTRSAADK